MKIKNIQIVLIIITITIIGFACSKSSDTTNTVATNCNLTGCHDPNNAAQIKASVVCGRMPKGRSFNATDKAALICWINNGAKNN